MNAVDLLAAMNPDSAYARDYPIDWESDLRDARVTVALMIEALRKYRRDEWAPVAAYSDNYWYMSGQPWAAAEGALARAGDPA